MHEIHDVVLYLKFCKPHHRQYKYLSRNFEETTSFLSAASNIPNLKSISSLAGSQLWNTLVVFAQLSRSKSQLLQSKYPTLHFVPFIEAVTFLHSLFQHMVCRSIDRRYHEAPSTCTEELESQLSPHRDLNWTPHLVLCYFPWQIKE